MIGACKPTLPLLDDAVDVLQKDNLKPTDQVSFLTTPIQPINFDHPAPTARQDHCDWPCLMSFKKDNLNPAGKVSF